MVLPRQEFDRYNPGRDPFYDEVPLLKLDDLKPRYRGKPKLSYMISTWNRRAQLSRALECLARQEFRAFEVLITDDGSTQNLQGVFDIFGEFLQLKVYKAERLAWRSCASRAYKRMLPDCEGNVVAIAHPEMMLDFAAMGIMYDCVHGKYDDTWLGIIDTDEQPEKFDWYWCSLKPQFLQGAVYGNVDSVDWHSDVTNLTSIPGYDQVQGFAGQYNGWHATRQRYPWWFVGAAKKDCPIWEAMPIFDGHGIIDMWMCAYRAKYKIVDTIPIAALCYHQMHQTSAIAPAGEQAQHVP